MTSAPVPFSINSNKQHATASCPAGHIVVSGGGVSTSYEGIAASRATTNRSSWYVTGHSRNPGEPNQYVQAYALCAPVQ